ncbi:MAG TPA: ATP-grasp domain-containing protein [Bryobacteraceae bacterium]|nr:ATP-grasp domain-containing protein [Bryobacteraceae bacterium]
MDPLTFLCLASYEKGHDFMREAKRQGARVFLITSLSLKDRAHWPAQSIDDIFYMPDQDKTWNRNDTLLAISHLARTQVIDRVVALDDFDLEMAASLREHLRIPGMGETTTRYFRDKLAMRMKAMEAGLNVPEFVHLLNDAKVREFTDRVPPPWVLKPRLMAGAIGIQMVHSCDELHAADHALGDKRSFFLVERFVPGDVCHVDSIVYENEIRFAVASQYGYPPLDVSHRGGIFTTRLLERGSAAAEALLAKNQRVLAAMGLLRGVSHTEFIRGDDGVLYFLETSARVGGAHIAELVEAATGLNLWGEWAKLEMAGGKLSYAPPQPASDYAALLVSLARQEHPDTSAYRDPEIVWRMERPYHVGMIVKSARRERVAELLEQYVERVKRDFATTAPPRDMPTN